MAPLVARAHRLAATIETLIVEGIVYPSPAGVPLEVSPRKAQARLHFGSPSQFIEAARASTGGAS